MHIICYPLGVGNSEWVAKPFTADNSCTAAALARKTVQGAQYKWRTESAPGQETLQPMYGVYSSPSRKLDTVRRWEREQRADAASPDERH